MEKIVFDKGNHPHNVREMWAKHNRVSRDNGKTGIVSINLLAGDASEDYSGYIPECCSELEPVAGACVCDGGTCDGCYALRMTRQIECFLMYRTNTLEAKADPRRFIELVEAELFSGDILNAPRVVRVHDSGDFFSVEYFAAVVDMIRRHPETRFGAYTKAAAVVNAYGLENIPDNFSLSCSPWAGHCDPIGDLPQFIYDAGNDPEIAALPHCPAVSKEGKRTGVTCNKCLHCYRANRGDRWAVYAH